MCGICRQNVAHQRMGALRSQGPFSTGPQNADPLISPNQYHWVFAQEVYAHPNARRPVIGDWALSVNTPDTCLYANSEFAIVSFRGSVTLADIRDDVRLSRPGDSGCAFDRVVPAVEMLKEWMAMNPQSIQCTGHSLGGAIAKCVGANLGLGVVTFNPAAPPSNPTSTGPNQINYHIVFDIISAWIPAVRIDKGFRPHKVNRFIANIPYASKLLFSVGISPILLAHDIKVFGNAKSGRVVSAETENAVWQTWFNSMPRILQKALLLFIQAPALPPVH